MYALCDVNAMYASCEKVFDPSIRNKPVVVLTNNDGCICAACGIAKRMGVTKKFVPYFKVKDDLSRIGAVIRSSNYELYADLSSRMMDVCSRFAPDYHIYSIDECFLKFDGYVPDKGFVEYAKQIRRSVWKEVRLPIGVGIGSTPTLAKAANHAAKRIQGFNGVAVVDNEDIRRYILRRMDVTDIWGIGRRLGARLNDMGIKTALQLADQPVGLIRKQFSILVESTVQELNGITKLSWDDVRAPKKEIYSTRSFGQRITEPDALKQALATHAEIVASKLRKQGSLAKVLVAFAHNSIHDRMPFYKRNIVHQFIEPTSDTRLILEAALSSLDRIYHPSIKFYKCGIGVMDLYDSNSYQKDLFSTQQDSPELMRCMDKINARYGRNTAHIASRGFEQKFAMRREFLSPQFTTRIGDIPKIHC